MLRGRGAGKGKFGSWEGGFARAGWSMRLSKAGSDKAPVTRRHELDRAFTRRNRALSAHAR